MPLYRQENPYQAAISGLQGAAQTSSAMTKRTETKTTLPDKTVGGGISSMIGGGLAGASLTSMLGLGGGAGGGAAAGAATGAAAGSAVPGFGTLIGSGIGAVLGLASYFL